MKKSRLSTKEKIKLFFMHVGLSITLILVLFPVVWVLAASLRQGGSLFTQQLFPSFSEMTLENYHKLFTETKFWIWMKNTLIVCVSATLLALVVTVTAGYAFSRMEFFGRKWGLMTMIIIQMFPAAMAMVAIYKLLLILSKSTGGVVGLNTLPGLILVYAGGGIPFNTWIIKGYLDGLPKELEESAYIDGATRTQAFLQVILPLMMPILAVVTIFNFIGPYADFLFPSIVMTGEDQFTLAVGMRAFISGSFSTNWTQFAAAAIVGALPILVIFFAFQKFLVEGLTKGALKG
ncbi:MAG: sugar ABC transporter permease [Vulcanimicrobiota bacterium]